jgi:hypothetical protein
MGIEKVTKKVDSQCSPQEGDNQWAAHHQDQTICESA